MSEEEHFEEVAEVTEVIGQDNKLEFILDEWAKGDERVGAIWSVQKAYMDEYGPVKGTIKTYKEFFA